MNEAEKANWLNQKISEFGDDYGNMLLFRVAAIAKELFPERSAKIIRKSLIGALAKGVLQATYEKSWVWVFNHSPTVDRVDNSWIPKTAWSQQHAQEISVTDGQLPSSDMFDWNSGRMRLWRSATYDELPHEMESLKTPDNYFQPVDWEEEFCNVKLPKQDFIRLMNDPKFKGYGTWLDDQIRNRRGPPSKALFDRTKASIIVQALRNPNTLKIALGSQAGTSAYIKQIYAAENGGEEPYERDLLAFAKLVFEANKLDCDPPIE